LRLLRILGAIALVALVTAVDHWLLHVNSSTAALSYLLLILGIATRAGLDASVAASVASMFGYNFYFLPPIGTLTIADPQNWVALFVFLITAITASHLSASAQKRADEASARRREMERLYEFSRALMIGSERPLPNRIAQVATELFDLRDAAFYETESDTISRGGSADSALTDDLLKEVARTGKDWHSAAGRIAVAPVRLGGRTLGSFGWTGAQLSDAALSAVAQLAAIAIERAREQEIANRMEAARQNEQLKATLLDALAHELKTPLTSIKAAISTMLSQAARQDADRELLTVADEEADRLTRLVNEALKVARIEAGELKLHRQPCPVSELVYASLDKLRAMDDLRNVQMNMQANLPDIDIDEELGELALRQLIENALKYAPPSSAIRISAERKDEQFVVLHVANDGPGIPLSEQEAIFEKFYRSRSVRDRIPGTGMGLTITREIVQAHGGRVWVESAPGLGVRFSMTLPVTPA